MFDPETVTKFAVLKGAENWQRNARRGWPLSSRGALPAIREHLQFRLKMRPTGNPISELGAVTGIIMPFDWDPNGRITEIAIYTFSEKVYRVAPNRLTQKIMTNYMHRRIRAQGQITAHRDGRLTIAVKEISIA